MKGDDEVWLINRSLEIKLPLPNFDLQSNCWSWSMVLSCGLFGLFGQLSGVVYDVGLTKCLGIVYRLYSSLYKLIFMIIILHFAPCGFLGERCRISPPCFMSLIFWVAFSLCIFVYCFVCQYVTYLLTYLQKKPDLDYLAVQSACWQSGCEMSDRRSR